MCVKMEPKCIVHGYWLAVYDQMELIRKGQTVSQASKENYIDEIHEFILENARLGYFVESVLYTS